MALLCWNDTGPKDQDLEVNPLSHRSTDDCLTLTRQRCPATFYLRVFASLYYLDPFGLTRTKATLQRLEPCGSKQGI